MIDFNISKKDENKSNRDIQERYLNLSMIY
nr:MAG TPA: hypothetical protein [Caudoviricetes sp.]